MPTLEEELKALKGALSVMESRHLSDVEQLREQVATMQRQLDEQQQQIFGQGQSFQQLEQALIYQFHSLNQSIATRFDEQTTAIRAQFENTNMQLGRVIGLVDVQEKDIREIKADVGIIKDQVVEVRQEIAEVRQDMNSRFEQVDKRLDRMDGRFEQVDQRFGVLDGRFDSLESKVDERFDQVIALLSQRGQ